MLLNIMRERGGERGREREKVRDRERADCTSLNCKALITALSSVYITTTSTTTTSTAECF